MPAQFRPWTIAFVAAVIAVLALKLTLAFTTGGAPDISVWKDFVAHINECGVCVYKTGGMMQYPGGSRLNPFNHPPFIIHFLRLIDFISSRTGLAFEIVFRSVTSLVDIASIGVMYRILRGEETFKGVTFLLYILAPATI